MLYVEQIQKFVTSTQILNQIFGVGLLYNKKYVIVMLGNITEHTKSDESRCIRKHQ